MKIKIVSMAIILVLLIFKEPLKIKLINYIENNNLILQDLIKKQI